MLLLSTAAWSASLAEPGDALGTALEEARAAGVAEDDLTRLLSLAGEGKLSPESAAVLVRTIQTARERGAPAGPLLAKIEEGLAKQVPVARIEPVLLKKLDNFYFARSLIPGARPEEVSALAESLDLGLSRDDLKGFLGLAPGAPPDMAAVAAENLALLKQLGFEKSLAEKVLSVGLEVKALTNGWRYFSRAVAAARARGETDEAIASASMEVLRSGGSPRDVLDRLGFTGRNMESGPVTSESESSGRVGGGVAPSQ